AAPLHANVSQAPGRLCALSAWNDDVRARAIVTLSTPSSKRFLLDKFAVMFSLDSDTTQAVAAEIEGLLGAGVWTEYSPAENARKITVPGLIIHGASDEFVPPQHAEELHANWSNSPMELIEGTGHAETARSPKVLALIPEYLQDVK